MISVCYVILEAHVTKGLSNVMSRSRSRSLNITHSPLLTSRRGTEKTVLLVMRWRNLSG